MAIKETEIIWHNGKYKPWHEATTHVLSHALHYGSSVFEGIRVYDRLGSPLGFRMREHLKRLYNSARIYRFEIPYDIDALMEAQRLGYDEGIGLAPDGTLSEGAGENLFMVKDNILVTPPQSSSILAGITRDSVIRLAHTMGIEVREMPMSRESIYLADELFFTGTAAEITPIRSVDDLEIGVGGQRPMTEKIQSAFYGLFDGRTEDRFGWLEPIDEAQINRGERDSACA